MQVTGNNILNESTFLIDESLLHSEPVGSRLCIVKDNENILITAWSADNRKLLGFENILITNETDPESISQKILDSELYRKVDFSDQVYVSSGTPSTLVPNPLYDPENSKALLNFSNTLDSDHSIVTDNLRVSEAKNIFAISKPLYEFLTEKFDNIEIHHISTGLIESQLSLNSSNNHFVITAVIHNTYMQVIISEGRQLLLYNNFQIENPESVVYYLLFCCEQLKINMESVDLRFAGKIGSSSAIYLSAKTYFRKTGFAETPAGIEPSYIFEDTPAHQFYPLYCIPACE